MGNIIAGQRGFIDRMYQFLFYLTGEFLFAGGTAFHIIEYLYKLYFDSKIRQKVTYQIGDEVDYENPKIVGRNRRPAHAFLRSFKKTEECLRYWSDSNRSDTDLKNVLFLTGEAGKPSEEHNWKFLLVGNPKECPNSWEQPEYTSVAGTWVYIPLPGRKSIPLC